jgi:magnesium transporter
MIQNLAGKQKQPFQWLDIAEPEQKELQQVAVTYQLHEASVQDSLQPDQLPKYERLKN